MPSSLAQFIKAIGDSRLFPAAELDALRASLAGRAMDDDAKELARDLVRQNKLTQFQARTLYQGRSRGLVLGSYVILDKIGSGGMGAVFKAEHRLMRRTVAIKVIAGQRLQSEEALLRFRREVEMAARLHHPNIVTAYDAAEDDGVLYLVMEYVEGVDLATLIRKQREIPGPMALNWITQAARGLEYSHQMGVIHRDIKPGNLLLNQHQQIKILDLGLARLEGPAERTEELSVPGEILGTVEFMAPEQAEDTRRADARSDVYSLGCTFYCMLTAEFMYPQDTVMKKLLAHRSQPIPSLRAKRNDIPVELEDVYRRMVAKHPDHRFQTMTELIAALETCRGPTVRARKAAAESKVRSRPQRPNLHAPTGPMRSDVGTTGEQLDFDVASNPIIPPSPAAQPPAAPASRPANVEGPLLVVVCGCGQMTTTAAQPGKRAVCVVCGRTTVVPELRLGTPEAFPVDCSCGQRYIAPVAAIGRAAKCGSCGRNMQFTKPAPREVTCRCGQRFAAEAFLAGKTVACPNCGRALQIPGTT